MTNADYGGPVDGQLYHGCVDYIWYSNEHLHPVSVLDVPSKNVILEHTALPSVIFPSDHLPLYTEFSFT